MYLPSFFQEISWFFGPHTRQYHSLIIRKRIVDDCKEEEIWGQLKSQFNCLGLKIKKGMILDATFIHLDFGHAKMDKPLEVKQK
jgi:hypothetical protein